MEDLATMPALATTMDQRYADVKRRIADAAIKSGRRPEDIVLVAVGKYAELDDIEKLMALGHVDFGESRVQQLEHRAAQIGERLERLRSMAGTAAVSSPLLAGADVRWHMIGRVQKNKARKLVGVTRLIHAVDSLKVAEELQNHAVKQDVEVEVLIQINATDEPQKAGVALTAAPHLAELIDEMFPLRPRGYMAMGPTSMDEAGTRLAFERTADVFRDTAKLGLAEGRFNILSMGMSHDFELAIELGANMVRVGSAIFGEKADSNDPDADDLED